MTSPIQSLTSSGSISKYPKEKERERKRETGRKPQKPIISSAPSKLADGAEAWQRWLRHASLRGIQIPELRAFHLIINRLKRDDLLRKLAPYSKSSKRTGAAFANKQQQYANFPRVSPPPIGRAAPVPCQNKMQCVFFCLDCSPFVMCVCVCVCVCFYDELPRNEAIFQGGT